jgi:hypothetical protein
LGKENCRRKKLNSQTIARINISAFFDNKKFVIISPFLITVSSFFGGYYQNHLTPASPDAPGEAGFLLAAIARHAGTVAGGILWIVANLHGTPWQQGNSKSERNRQSSKSLSHASYLWFAIAFHGLIFRFSSVRYSGSVESLGCPKSSSQYRLGNIEN